MENENAVVTALKWRPTKFKEVVGQEAVVRTIMNSIRNKKHPHAFLFTGPRGVGKTTTARLVAKALNCTNPQEGEPCNECSNCLEIAKGSSVDVFEIDAASNGQVDDARELRDRIRYAPMKCKTKVLIIDEVHMMSNAAFNALLKTLEEPPANTVFILATTEDHKVPRTIVSRCQGHNFRLIPDQDIVACLKGIAQGDGIVVEDNALYIIAKVADGSLRDAQTLFDKVLGYNGENQITFKSACESLGAVDDKAFAILVDLILSKQPAQALKLVKGVFDAGLDLRRFVKDWVEYWRQMVQLKIDPSQADRLYGLSSIAKESITRQVQSISTEQLIRISREVVKASDDMGRSNHFEIILELTIISLCGE